MKLHDIYVRNMVLGVSDGLVSTVGLLSGMGVAGTVRSTIILTGLIYACVEALSMAVGSFLSEESVEIGKRVKPWTSRSLIAASVMFMAFFLAALVPLAPYAFALDSLALWLSVVISLLALFFAGLMVGFFTHRISRRRLIRHAIKMVLLGGGAILVGVLIGKFVVIG
jgi:VIT1/CCC1 family predicted Fe2+/Mn2+ transporter